MVRRLFSLLKSHENGPKTGPKCKKMEKTGLNFEPRAQPKSRNLFFLVICRWRIGFYFLKKHFEPRAEGSILLMTRKNDEKCLISNEKMGNLEELQKDVIN